jgi:large subunit ribosomal protein L18
LTTNLRAKVDGKTKTEQAKLVGELVAKRAKDKGVTRVVFDRGGFRYIGRVKALADAARESGLEF